MYSIQQITTAPWQQQNLILPDGNPILFELYYAPLQYSWRIKRLVYGDFILENYRICISPNILRQYKNKIPFGIACFATGNREPLLQEDFATGNAKLYLLTQDEVQAFEDSIRA